MALASIEDVKGAIGRALTKEETQRAHFLIGQLSERFTQEARTDFQPTEHTHRVKVNNGHARPSRGPIRSVKAVMDDDGNPIPFRIGHGYVSVPVPSHAFVVITYTAGHDKTPPAVTGCIADEVRRILTIDTRAATGQTQGSVTAGPFTETASFAAHAIGAQAMLSPDAVNLARAYRPLRPGNHWVTA